MLKLSKNGRQLSYEDFCKSNKFIAIQPVNSFGTRILINNKGKKSVDYVFGNLPEAVKDWKKDGYTIIRI